MNTANLILSMVLSFMIGFAIGNIWGKETMKRNISALIQKLTEGLKLAADSAKKKEE